MAPCGVVACSASAGHKDNLGPAALTVAYKTIMVYRVLVPVATVKDQIALWSVVCLHVWRRQLGMHAAHFLTRWLWQRAQLANIGMHSMPSGRMRCRRVLVCCRNPLIEKLSGVAFVGSQPFTAGIVKSRQSESVMDFGIQAIT